MIDLFEEHLHLQENRGLSLVPNGALRKESRIGCKAAADDMISIDESK